MCVIRDECVLLAMLAVQLVGGLPVVALMRVCSAAYVALYAVGAVLGVSITFAPRLRWYCSNFVGFVNEVGICVYLLTHMGLLALSAYTLYLFLLPFFYTSTVDGARPSFEELCETKHLDDNLSHTGCDDLQGLYALSLIALTAAILATAYLLLLGSRITRRNWTENAQLLKDDVV